MNKEFDVEKFSKELVKRYGYEKASKIADELVKKVEAEKRELKPFIGFGPNPSHVKALLLAMSGGKVLDSKSTWSILNSQFSKVKDPKQTYTIGILDWNPSLFQRATEKKGDRRWKLTDFGEELSRRLSSTKNLDELDKALFAPLYLNNSITRAVYDVFKGKNLSRREGVKLLKAQASQVGITQAQVEWYVGEKTSALVAVGLLERRRGKETIYT